MKSMKCRECPYCNHKEQECNNTVGMPMFLDKKIMDMEACPLGCKIKNVK